MGVACRRTFLLEGHPRVTLRDFEVRETPNHESGIKSENENVPSDPSVGNFVQFTKENLKEITKSRIETSETRQNHRGRSWDVPRHKTIVRPALSYL